MSRKQELARLEQAARRQLSPENPYNLSETDQTNVVKIVAFCRLQGGPVTADDITLAADFVVAEEWEWDDPQSVVCGVADFFGVSHDSVCH